MRSHRLFFPLLLSLFRISHSLILNVSYACVTLPSSTLSVLVSVFFLSSLFSRLLQLFFFVNTMCFYITLQTNAKQPTPVSTNIQNIVLEHTNVRMLGAKKRNPGKNFTSRKRKSERVNGIETLPSHNFLVCRCVFFGGSSSSIMWQKMECSANSL